MRLSPFRAATALLLALPLLGAPAVTHAATPSAPVAVGRSPHAVPGEYIVTLKPGRAAGEVLRTLRVTPRFSYTDALNGFAARLDPALLRAVRTSPAVAAVEENSRLTVHGSARRDGPPGRATRAPAPVWGLDRIDQRALPLDHAFTTRGHGEGVSAYVVDTGIDYTHPEFGGRAVPGFDAVGDGGNGLDCNGHGTHVAGTVGGLTYGVAPRARLVSVRVVDCTGNGDKAQYIAGLDWVARNAEGPAVVNASLGEEKSTAINDATTALSGRGVLPVVSAGNDASDACSASPASAAGVLTVAASDREDRESDFSNWGPCVSLYAPGQAITSAWPGGGSRVLNGTSMAAPHATGVAALYLAGHPAATPEAVRSFLVGRSTGNALTHVHPGTPNRLLFTAGL
ncbi:MULTISPECIES: S8 family peptidase [unclassified Streptomyces]|uniref:S8 family peptidase n=1 Tax=unclassified Streptomyces TaxID=2593676 RepID=UPI002E2C5196|nr:S8 family peptidase [Streptomyces sp. NBC_01429]